MAENSGFALWRNQEGLDQTILDENASRYIGNLDFRSENNTRAAIIGARGQGKTHLCRLIQSKAIQSDNGSHSVVTLFVRGDIFEYRSSIPSNLWGAIVESLVDENSQLHDEFSESLTVDIDCDHELLLAGYFGESGRRLILIVDDFDWMCNYWERENCFEENMAALSEKPWIDLIVSVNSDYFAEDSIGQKFELIFDCMFLGVWKVKDLYELMMSLALNFGPIEQAQMFKENRSAILGLVHLIDESPKNAAELYGLLSRQGAKEVANADTILDLAQIHADRFRNEVANKLSPLETRIYYCFAVAAKPVSTSKIASQLNVTKGTVRTLVARLHKYGLINKSSVASFLERTGIQLYLHPEKYCQIRNEIQGILDFFSIVSMEGVERDSTWHTISTTITSKLRSPFNPRRDHRPTERIKKSDNIALQSLRSNPFSALRTKIIDEKISVLGDSISQLEQSFFDQNELALLKGEFFETELECLELALMAYEESKLDPNDGNYLMRLFRLMLISRRLCYRYYHDQIARRFFEALNAQGEKDILLQLMWRVIKESRDKMAFLWACDYVYSNADNDFGKALSEYIQVNQIDSWQLRILVEYVSTSSSTQAKETLISLCEHRSSTVRANAVRCLVNFGDTDSISAVKNLINDESPLVGANALYCFALHDANKAIPILLDRLVTADPNVHNFILKALGRIGDTKYLPEIERSLSSHVAEVRAAATEALADIDSPRVLDLLEENLTDPSSIVLQATAKSLEQFSSEKALELLMTIANGPDTLSQIQALRQLAKHECRESIGLLIALCSHKDYLVRYHALEAVRHRESDLVANTCIKRLKDPSALVRVSAVRGIATLKIEVDNLLPLLKDEVWLVRYEVCNVLGSLGRGKFVNQLVSLIEDEHIEVRNAAAVAVAKIGGDGATILLNRIFSNHEYDREEILWQLNSNNIQSLDDYIIEGWKNRTERWKAGAMQALRTCAGDIHEDIINEGLHDLSPQVQMLALLVIIEKKLKFELFDIGNILKAAELTISVLPGRLSKLFLQRLLFYIFQCGDIHSIERCMIYASQLEEQFSQLIQLFSVAQDCLRNTNETRVLKCKPKEIRHAIEYIIPDTFLDSH
jgi:HEAT repeat protein/predicted transcriptional regulator